MKNVLLFCICFISLHLAGQAITVDSYLFKNNLSSQHSEKADSIFTVVNSKIISNALNGSYQDLRDYSNNPISHKQFVRLISTRDTIITFDANSKEEKLMVVEYNIDAHEIDFIHLVQEFDKMDNGHWQSNTVTVGFGRDRDDMLFYIGDLVQSDLSDSNHDFAYKGFLNCYDSTQSQTLLKHFWDKPAYKNHDDKSALTLADIEMSERSIDTIMYFNPITKEESLKIVEQSIDKESMLVRLVQDISFSSELGKLMIRPTHIAPVDWYNVELGEAIIRYGDQLYFFKL